MAIFAALVCAVATVQGFAWIGRGGGRRRVGMWLAPAGLLFFALACLWAFVPDFFADGRGFDGR